ncbi:MAG: hypothetical protein R6V32_11360 [Bacteroidales bacterium]
MIFDKKHKEAIIGVVVYLAIVVALLLFLGLYKPDPPPEEEGIVMDFGGSGSGSTDPGPSEASTESATQNNTETESQTTPESNMTQSHEEAPELPDYNTTEESEEQNNNNVPEEEEEEQQEEVNDNVSEIMNTNWGNTSDSEADGEGSGEPGSGDGGEGGEGNGEGPGSGNVAGNGWSLSGRSAENIPKPSVANCDGHVIVNIEVDRAGNVVNAYAKPGGCTACESHCINKAVESAKNSRFNADNAAKVRQSGTITYRFRPK